MKVTSLMTNARDKVNLLGRMAVCMMACGVTVSSMAVESSSLRTTLKELVSGKMEKRSDGFLEHNI
jgi:hypothetical protein